MTSYVHEDMKVLEQIEQIDDVEYELAVRDESAGFFGSWFCSKCWQGGVNYDLMQSVDDAVKQAERGAIRHHESAHR